jgi:molecular chaperone HscB
MKKSIIENQNMMTSDVTPFALLSVEPAYHLDWSVVDCNLVSLQEILHPDLYPIGSEERSVADAMLSSVNNAYAVLKDPIQRARILLKLKNIGVPGENGETINDPEMMEEALLLKQFLEEASAQNDFDSLFETLNNQQKKIEELFNLALLANTENDMKDTYIRLSFCIKTHNDAKALCFKSKGH